MLFEVGYGEIQLVLRRYLQGSDVLGKKGTKNCEVFR